RPANVESVLARLELEEDDVHRMVGPWRRLLGTPTHCSRCPDQGICHLRFEGRSCGPDVSVDRRPDCDPLGHRGLGEYPLANTSTSVGGEAHIRLPGNGLNW